MLEEKRKDLIAEKQRKLIASIVEELSRQSPEFYYQSTSAIAAQIQRQVKESKTLTQDDRALLAPLSQRDIEIRLSLH